MSFLPLSVRPTHMRHHLITVQCRLGLDLGYVIVYRGLQSSEAEPAVPVGPHGHREVQPVGVLSLPGRHFIIRDQNQSPIESDPR